jgi:hypothetical protein
MPASIPRVTINLRLTGRSLTDIRPHVVTSAPDGTFKIGGLREGLARFDVPPVKGFIPVRLELNGAEVNKGIVVKDGEQVTGVRLILVYGTGVVRGQVIFEPGARVEGARYAVEAILTSGSNPQPIKRVELDDKGRYTLAELPAGEYELVLVGSVYSGQPRPPRVSQKAIVANSAEAQVNFVVKASK